MAKSATSKSNAPNAIDYLTNPAKYTVGHICALSGDEAFLKAEVRHALRGQVLSGDDGDFSLSVFAGAEAQLRDVRDALSTQSLGGGPRLVIVEDADPFVTLFRSELEDLATGPGKGSVLVLDVTKWPANTRLAKIVAASGLTIECRQLNERQTKTWLIARAKSLHDVRLDAAAADALLELLPSELGILAQEIDKLAPLKRDDGSIDVKLVRDNVGGWRTRTTWDMIDAACDGRAAQALAQLDRLILAGEKPHGLLPQIGSSLRRFATATRLIEAGETSRQRMPFRDALAEAGTPPFILSSAERQLRQIGRGRAKQLIGWLLAADLAVKGHNSSDDSARIEIEQLIVRLSAAAQHLPTSAR